MCRLCNGHGVGPSVVGDGKFSEIEAFEECRGTTHERIMDLSKICTVAHLICTYVRGIAFAADMINCDSVVFDPFAGQIIL
jgi:hypothetical protein